MEAQLVYSYLGDVGVSRLGDLPYYLPNSSALGGIPINGEIWAFYRNEISSLLFL